MHFKHILLPLVTILSLFTQPEFFFPKTLAQEKPLFHCRCFIFILTPGQTEHELPALLLLTRPSFDVLKVRKERLLGVSIGNQPEWVVSVALIFFQPAASFCWPCRAFVSLQKHF